MVLLASMAPQASTVLQVADVAFLRDLLASQAGS